MWTSIETPSLGQLFSFSSLENSPIEKKFKKNARNKLYWTNRTLQSLQEICIWFKIENKRNPVIMIPTYICYEVPEVFKLNSADLIYYDIDEKFNVDLNSITNSSRPVDIFLAVHFFGIASDLTQVRKWCTKNNVVLIEDSTHVVFPTETIGNHGDICLYSPYKHFPVPDGACAVFKDTFIDLHPLLKKRFENITSTPALPFRWIVKKFLQSIFRLSRKNPLLSHGHDPERSLIKVSERGISDYSLNILSRYTEEDLTRIQTQRLENNKSWEEMFSYMNLPNESTHNSPVPMNYIVETSLERNHELFGRFNELGMYPSTWPTLPVEENIYSAHAKRLRQSITLLPVHQGIRSNDYLKLINSLENDHSELTLIPFTGTETQWDECLQSLPHSNILHTNAYLRARVSEEGGIIEKFIFQKDNIFQGVASVRIKKKGPIKIAFINRAPLLVNLCPLLAKKAIQALRAHYSLTTLTLLFVAPELPATPINTAYFKSLKLIKLPLPLHHSAKISLEHPLSELRSNLDSKWRNLLKKGESFTPEITASESKEDYDRFLKLYEGFVQNKNFEGLSIGLLKNYYDSCDVNHKPLTLFLLKNSEIISAVLIARYAKEALYLAGINNDEGRKACGNYVLLWRAVEILSAQDLKHFDLGGFDDINTPHITHFKRQMGGVEYKLVGSFLVLK